MNENYEQDNATKYDAKNEAAHDEAVATAVAAALQKSKVEAAERNWAKERAEAEAHVTDRILNIFGGEGAFSLKLENFEVREYTTTGKESFAVELKSELPHNNGRSFVSVTPDRGEYTISNTSSRWSKEEAAEMARHICLGIAIIEQVLDPMRDEVTIKKID